MLFAEPSPNVGCSIGVTHNSRPVAGVIALPFLGRIVSLLLTPQLTSVLSA